MARYHLYYLKQGMLVGSGDIEATDDDDAARMARKLGDGQVVEVWNDYARVRVVSTARFPSRRDSEALPATATPNPHPGGAT